MKHKKTLKSSNSKPMANPKGKLPGKPTKGSKFESTMMGPTGKMPMCKGMGKMGMMPENE